MPASVVLVSKSASDLVLFVALTLKSFVLELNLSARLTVVLPHLD